MKVLAALKAIAAGERLWRMAHPVTRIKRKLNKRRARLGKPLLEINTPEEIDVMNGDQLQGIIRHILTTAGGGLVAAGTITEAQLIAIAGGVSALIGVAWSFWQKRA